MKRNNSFEAIFETSDNNFYRNYEQANIILNYIFLLETNKSPNSIVFKLISADKQNSGKRFPYTTSGLIRITCEDNMSATVLYL